MIRCIECGKWFKPVANERIHSAGCRDKRRSTQAHLSKTRKGRASYLPRPEPVEMAVVLPFNPASPFLTDEQRRVCAEARA